MNRKEFEIQELNFEKFLAILFIIASVLNYYGDSIQQNFLKYSNPQDEKKAKTLFVIALIITIVAYLYFIKRDKDNVLYATLTNGNVRLEQVRLFASILILVGFLIILYYFIVKPTPIGSPPV